jgi:NRAMP (natural resistance-associated macrophage protein)-like metal ion transporter
MDAENTGHSGTGQTTARGVPAHGPIHRAIPEPHADNFDDLPHTDCDGAATCAPPPVAPPIDEQLAAEPSRVRRCLKVLGPGVISGASNNDPSAIATYAGAGAALGLSTLWAVPLLLPMMATVVFVCAKLGMTAGRGLAGVVREHYSRWLLYPMLVGIFCANTLNAGADQGAIAAGVRLIVPAVPEKVALIVIALGLLALQVWAGYRTIARLFKWLTLALFAFVVAGILAKPDWGQVLLRTLVPTVRFDAAFLSTLVAYVGTALSPYLYVWQTSQRVEEEVCMGRRRLWQRQGATEGELKYASWDVNTGMTVAAVMIYFILLCTASTLNKNGQLTIATAAEAASALQPLAGRFAGILFAIGFVGAGLLAVPVLTTGAAYAVAEGLGWKFGLDRPPAQARGFYAVMAASTLVGLAINFADVNSMRLLFVAALVNGLLASPMLILIMRASNNRAVVGDKTNGPWINALGWITTAAALAAAATLIVTSVRQ